MITKQFKNKQYKSKPLLRLHPSWQRETDVEKNSVRQAIQRRWWVRMGQPQQHHPQNPTLQHQTES